jgi:hypothetical protein
MSYPVRYRIKARQGDTCLVTFILKQGDDEPQDLTGYTGRMQVRATPDAKQVLLDATDFITVGGPEEDPTTGIVQVEIPASALETVKPSPKGGYAYDLELVSGDFVFTPIAGPFTVAQEVTR